MTFMVEPKTLRYRLLDVAARLVRGQRRTKIRIDHRWPWARDLGRGPSLTGISPPLIT